ncbi:MAG TPA: type II toxin-antitoxin system HigB family toxin [Anaerolineae bacterium]|nr:type II toxin-antitoxin system HigB family toxin [Anaerolineae bacterium]
MHIIAKRTLRMFWTVHADSQRPLMRWHRIVDKGQYNNFAELRRVFPSADMVNNLVIFNIGGNKYRLIVDIEFRSQTVFIKHILTHKEYDQGAWKK